MSKDTDPVCYRYYAIRHIKTGDLMPEVKTRGGYSHWNPDNPNMPKQIFFGHPRLFLSMKSAKSSISQWFACQNGRRTTMQSYDGEYDDIVNFKLDNRKKEDLEVVAVDLEVKEKLD